eukprot:SAG31_NODE_1045_length_10180_cov_5.454221_3_plen_99_part_00
MSGPVLATLCSKRHSSVLLVLHTYQVGCQILLLLRRNSAVLTAGFSIAVMNRIRGGPGRSRGGYGVTGTSGGRPVWPAGMPAGTCTAVLAQQTDKFYY